MRQTRLDFISLYQSLQFNGYDIRLFHTGLARAKKQTKLTEDNKMGQYII